MKKLSLIDNLIYKLNKSSSIKRKNRLKLKLKDKLRNFFSKNTFLIYIENIDEYDVENVDLLFKFSYNKYSPKENEKYLQISIKDNIVLFEVEVWGCDYYSGEEYLSERISTNSFYKISSCIEDIYNTVYLI